MADEMAGVEETPSVPTALHPRMRARREEIQQEEGRRRRHLYLWLAALPAVVGLLFALAHTPFVAVADVQVEGGVRTTSEEVVTAANIGRGRPMLTLDANAASRRVAALAWVDEVKVERRWPRTVRIMITERTPAAAVVADGSNIVGWVDATGRVLHLAGAAPEGLVTVTGLGELPDEGSELPEEARDALRVATVAAERLPGTLATVSLELEGELAQGAPAPGALVYFRSGDAVDDKLVALDTLLAGADRVGCVKTVDLRVPGNPALTRHPDCS